MKHLYNEDTIVALSTPIGRGAIAIIRLSGKDALGILNETFSKKIHPSDHHRATIGEILSQTSKKPIDQVIVVFYKGPHSYTGEDLVEISCHCNRIIIDEILNEMILAGARIAKPGEFTERAFLNQKIDLSQAEAVATLIDAKTRRSVSNSLRQLEGALSQRIHHIKDQIIEISSLIEVSLDFNEEDIAVYETSQICTKINNILVSLDKMISSYEYGRYLREGIKVVFLGKPNVGKSSLLNALIEKERAIVSEIPGTTRDYIEEHSEIEGIPVQLVDTAGIRVTEDPIEEMGVQKAIGQVKSADVVIALFEQQASLDENDMRLLNYIAELRSSRPFVMVLNKSDLGTNEITLEELKNYGLPLVQVSAKTGHNLQELKESIKKILLTDSEIEEEEFIITNIRHKNALLRARESLISFQNNLIAGIDEVILAADLRSALDYIGEITGETTTEDILNHIFSQFCIGK